MQLDVPKSSEKTSVRIEEGGLDSEKSANIDMKININKSVNKKLRYLQQQLVELNTENLKD